MRERLKAIKERYEEITKELSNPEVVKNIKKMTSLSKEQSELEEVYRRYLRFLEVEVQLKELEDLKNDPDMADLAKEEETNLIKEQEELNQEMEKLLIPKDPNDDKNVIVEIKGAAGGDEANIFAGDLYRMYMKYTENQNLKIEILNSVTCESGGFSNIEFMVKGKGAYSKLKYESGAHRVQRVPSTETQGRVHTSTATVLVMPEAEEVEIEVKNEDLRVDVYRSGGAGGQSVNTTDSAVRITHLPTNTVVTCQNERSQLRNKETALKILKAKLYDLEEKRKQEEEGKEIKEKIGTGDRSEKIRTYNYPQNRVTDHRINLTLKQLDRVMEGNLEEIIEALISDEQTRLIQGQK